MNRSSLFTLFWIQAICLTSCFSRPTDLAVVGTLLPLPTKDEVARVDGRPLTIQDFLTIRSRLQNPSDATALWVGISSIALQNNAHSRGRSIQPEYAIDIARYAVGDLQSFSADESLKEYFPESQDVPSPESVKKEIDALTQRSLVQKSSRPLSHFY